MGSLKMSRVVLAMSGGVDSSVAASLLKSEGHDVIGVFMRHGEESAACAVGDGGSLPVVSERLVHKQGCCTASDAADARRVAERLGIPFFAIDMQRDFRRIVDYFVDEYTRGRTPNPCVQCNNWIKFGALFDYADAVDAEYVATGHYAQLRSTGDPADPIGLYRGLDESKDQSYVLAGISRPFLSRMLLPVGGFRKTEIRRMAEDIGLAVASKKDSQEICFVTTGHHGDFIRGRGGLIDREGAIATRDGRIVGRHNGIENFTIGQRKKLGVAMTEPYFVVDIDAVTQTVIIGRRDELQKSWLIAGECNWLTPAARSGPAGIQIRYASKAYPGYLTPAADGRTFVSFNDSVSAVAPGQLAVFYDEDRVLGGGWIETSGTGERDMGNAGVAAD